MKSALTAALEILLGLTALDTSHSHKIRSDAHQMSRVEWDNPESFIGVHSAQPNIALVVPSGVNDPVFQTAILAPIACY